MSELTSYSLLPEITGLDPSVKLLQDLEETTFEDTINMAEHTLFHELVHETRKMITEDETINKPAISAGNTLIQRGVNCTDYARVALSLGEAIGRNCYGVFYEGHASSIISSDSVPDFWQIDGFSGPKADLNRILFPESDTDEVQVTKDALEQMGSHKGSYVYWDTNTETWEYNHFDTEDIRGATPFGKESDCVLSINHSSMAIVGIPLAHKMLNAIDILAALNHESQTNYDAIEEYESAKKLLKQYYPRFS